jgi:hypothetical protein
VACILRRVLYGKIRSGICQFICLFTSSQTKLIDPMMVGQAGAPRSPRNELELTKHEYPRFPFAVAETVFRATLRGLKLSCPPKELPLPQPRA